jgi:hypothetical protein
MSMHMATRTSDVRVEVHSHRRPARRAHGLLLQSSWWLLVFVGAPVAALVWLGVGAYTLPQVL